MPYTIKKQGDKYVVKKANGSKVFGRHSTKKKAKAQIRAIEANERESQQTRIM